MADNNKTDSKIGLDDSYLKILSAMDRALPETDSTRTMSQDSLNKMQWNGVFQFNEVPGGAGRNF